MCQYQITLEQLKEWNPNYHPWDIRDEVNEKDLEIANRCAKAFISNADCFHNHDMPADGDLVIYKSYHGIYPKAMFCRDFYGTGNDAICEQASAYVGEEGGISVSGGTFPGINAKDLKMIWTTATRQFWTFGRYHGGPHCGIYFQLPVWCWMHVEVGELAKN